VLPKTIENDSNTLAKIICISKKTPLSPLMFVESVRTGLPLDGFLHLAKLLCLTQQELSEILKINPRTLNRRKKGQLLHPDESDKLYRVARLYVLALEVLENSDDAVDWLKNPKIALNKAIPLNLMDTDAGAREVERLLNQLKYGVYP
jgi:putative toxin-antitoxin system antitoxin component (TIGR02293 family)